MVVSLNSLEREVMVVCSELTRSMVVRFLPVLSSGVVGSSPLFWAWGICVCSCTMGGCEPDTLSLAVRLDMFATEPSDGNGERDELGGPYALTWALVLPVPTSGAAVGSIAGTLGENSETCGTVTGLSPPETGAGATEEKFHVSLRVEAGGCW
jgi:hypothetical protein